MELIIHVDRPSRHVTHFAYAKIFPLLAAMEQSILEKAAIHRVGRGAPQENFAPRHVNVILFHPNAETGKWIMVNSVILRIFKGFVWLHRFVATGANASRLINR